MKTQRETNSEVLTAQRRKRILHGREDSRSDDKQMERLTRATQPGWGARLSRNKRILVPFFGGAGLLAWGLSRRGWLGTLAAIGGGYLAAESANRIRPYHYGIHLSQTINKPVSEVYEFARNRENWAFILERIGHPREAHQLSAKAPLNRRIEFHPQIWKEERDQVIAWQSRGRQVTRRGAMRFRPAPGNRGTEVVLGVEYHYSALLISRSIGLLLGRDPEQRARKALRALKQLLETGEIATIEGQPSGRRGLRGKLMTALFREPVSKPSLAA